MYKPGFILAVLMVFGALGISARAQASYSVSEIQEISSNAGVLYGNTLINGSLTNPDDNNCSIKFDGKDALNIKTTEKGSFVSKSFELPAAQKGESKSLFLKFEEEYSFDGGSGAIYIRPEGGERYLLDVRNGNSVKKEYVIDITSFAGKNVQFE